MLRCDWGFVHQTCSSNTGRGSVSEAGSGVDEMLWTADLPYKTYKVHRVWFARCLIEVLFVSDWRKFGSNMTDGHRHLPDELVIRTSFLPPGFERSFSCHRRPHAFLRVSVALR